MNGHRRISWLDAAALLAGVCLALWGTADFSVPASKILAGVCLASAALAGRKAAS